MDKNIKSPLVSVIMPVYNAEKYVAEAIESILNQTFTDFEFLIFNDGSKDKSAEIVQSYAQKDSRIVFYNYQENRGLPETLNKGIDIAQGKYIARMDNDDISLPHRFERQLAFMENNEEVGLCGTWFSAFENNIENIVNVAKMPILDENIKVASLHYCCIAHPTVMAKTSLLKNNKYDQSFYPADDYELWARLIPLTKLHNIPESLLLYRLHETNISREKTDIQQEIGRKIQLLQFERFFANHKNIHYALLKYAFIERKPISYSTEAYELAKLIKQMYESNQFQKIYDKNIFIQFLNEIWQPVVKRELNDYRLALLYVYLFFPLPTFSLLSWKEKIKFVLRCILRWKK